MERVTMKHRGMQFLSLEVPGLAERRPSLVYGDYIFAQPAYQDASGMKPYQVLYYNTFYSYFGILNIP